MKYLTLDEYKAKAEKDMQKGKITKEFYTTIFLVENNQILEETTKKHYTLANGNKIFNYKF
jgi:hypothetical protein